jgi:hypothetical protein
MQEVAAVVGASDVAAMASRGEASSDSVVGGAVAPGLFQRAPPQRRQQSMPLRGRIARGAAPAPAESGQEVANLLEALRNEPRDNNECAAKFMLYETYFKQVEGVRETLTNFHQENRQEVPTAVATYMDEQVKAIDSEDGMGIPDESREWFVYHMVIMAERNNKKMTATLDRIDKKLKFLKESDQQECPVCLESFDRATRKPETLGCCHKVCEECWRNWCTVTNGHPFCPLCRNEEFLGALAARVPTAPPAAAPSAGFFSRFGF